MKNVGALISRFKGRPPQFVSETPGIGDDDRVERKKDNQKLVAVDPKPEGIGQPVSDIASHGDQGADHDRTDGEELQKLFGLSRVRRQKRGDGFPKAMATG